MHGIGASSSLLLGGGDRLVRYVVLILSVHIASHTLACVAEWGVAGVVVGANL